MAKVEEIAVVDIEGQADWAALESSIAKPVPDAGAEVAPVADPVAEAEEMFGFVVATLAGLVPVVEEWYPKERVRRMAETYVPLAERRGWSTWGWLEKYGLELAFAGALVPPQLMTIAISVARAKFFPTPNQQALAQPSDQVKQPGAGQGKTIVFGSPDAAPAA